ncbi:glycosyltransferase [Herbiconiux sp. SYSU D00978]|uniref:glycosyltransferase n=1 Tax=Herbiconiux sp. SYSU D00978 TaxID=2812562 RepID=UPI001A961C5A|nr:glycosyltransferase [Herbiconiux sp. SYSU D00978]
MSTSAFARSPLQRVVFPSDHDPDIVPLYVDADFWTTLPVHQEREALEHQRGFVYSDPGQAVVRMSDVSMFSAIRGDRGFQIPHQRKVSFGTYFNAFPASYWRHHTTLDAVVLRVTTRGSGQVLVYRSNARGVIQRMDTADVNGEQTVEFSLPFTYFGDGGWLWFDLVAEDSDFALVEAGWYAPEGAEPNGGRQSTVSIGITTYNRAEYCVQLLRDLASVDAVRQSIDKVYVVDQGTQKIRDAADFSAAETELGGRLQLIEQANLGGSGGFSRAMYETLQAGVSDHVLLLDDDIAIEPEGVLRALRFSDYALRPTIVGGHMFDMYDKTKLHAFGEGIDFFNFMWGPKTPHRHDFASSNLRQTRWLHRRIDVDYNGWWMCLIPVSVIRKVGLSLPVFIKWDDSEFALRAGDKGVPTVSLPGAAVWHVSWVDKDDSQDWQAFFHARNRLVAALLHSPFEKGGRLTRDNLALDVKHLLSMQYFAVAARHEAYRNVLSGPRQLHDDIQTRQGEVRELAKRFPETQLIKSKVDLPEIVDDAETPDPNVLRRNPPGKVWAFRWLLRNVPKHFFSTARAKDKRPPEVHLAFEEARWWVLPLYDSALVTNAEGSAVAWHRRDGRLFRKMLIESFLFRRRIRREWAELSKRYRAALPEITSPDTWAKTLKLDDESRSR